MMLGRFRQWLRVVLVSDAILWAAVACVLVIWLGQRALIVWLRVFAPVLTESEMGMVSRPAHAFALIPIAALYGFYRVVAFHPVANRHYGRWLAQTPWKYPQPLPLGPLKLVWQDAAFISILLAFSLLPPYGNLIVLVAPIVVFLIVYCAILAYWHWLFEARWSSIAFVALMVVSLQFLVHPFAWLVVAFASYGIVRLGIEASLRDFPYSEARREALHLVPFERQPAPEIPWPIMPADDEHWWIGLTPLQAALIGLLVGGIFYGVAIHFREEPGFVRGVLTFHGLFAIICVGVRLGIYLGRCRPPISLLGRVATRRLIIPGYDIVFVGPLVAVLAAVAVPPILMWIGIGPGLAFPLSTAVTVWLALTLPPPLKRWYFTGHYQIPPVRRFGQLFVEM